MTEWRDPQSAIETATILGIALQAYPARNHGKFAVHLWLIFGIPRGNDFSMEYYRKYREGRLVSLDGSVSMIFDRFEWLDAKRYSIDGQMNSVHLHAITYSNRPRLKDCLMRVELEMGFKVAHPIEPETHISQLVALQVREGTGVMSEKHLRSD
jgi:hypothetical protein